MMRTKPSQPESERRMTDRTGGKGTSVAWERAGEGCLCWVNPEPWTYYGVVEPGDALVPDPDCPEHFPNAANQKASTE